MRPVAVVTMIIGSVLMLLVMVGCTVLVYGCAHAVQVGCQRQPGAITCHQ